MSELQVRETTAVFGDWSDDGHGKTDSVRLRITGVDVSNEALSAARAKAEALVGFSVETICEDYEDSSIDEDNFITMLQHGLPILTAEGEEQSPVLCYIDEDTISAAAAAGFTVLYSDIDAVKVTMAFLGYGIEGFSYEIIPDDVIIGTWGAPISGFGYGLYY